MVVTATMTAATLDLSIAPPEPFPGMSSQGNVPVAFLKAAARGGVAESDFLLLGSLGIHTFEGFGFRLPRSEDLEEFLRATVCPKEAYKDDTGVVTIYDRTPAVLWQEFKTSEDAAALRKLWLLAREICKAEVESLASGDTEGSRTKVSISGALAMEQAAVLRGMPKPSSDVERPSLYALTKTTKAMVGPNASYEHLSWEIFVTLDDESRLMRAGKIPKATNEVVLSKDQKLALREKSDNNPLGEKANDLETVRKYLETRARCFELLEVAKFSTYRRLNEAYYSKLLGNVPTGMRPPTLMEVRRFDRVMHEELLRWCSRHMGSLDDGVVHYLDNDGLNVWRLDPVISSLPDQGVEGAPTSSEGHKAAKRKAQTSSESEGEKKRKSEKTKEKGGPLKKCLVCGKKHHPLCPLPEGFRKRQREERKLKQKKAKEEGGKDARADKKAK